MIDYSAYVGRQFTIGSTDCFGILRDCYINEYGITVPNYARPMDFWDHGMNMYCDRLRKLGFKVVDDFEEGDVVVMAIQSEIGNHAAIITDTGQILHHIIGRMSNIENYGGLWRNTTIATFRHPEVRSIIETKRPKVEVDYRTLLSPAKRRQIDELAAKHADG